MSSSKSKDSSKKAGDARRHKEQKRKDAEARNAEYQALSLEEKLARQTPGGKVWNKLKKKG